MRAREIDRETECERPRARGRTRATAGERARKREREREKERKTEAPERVEASISAPLCNSMCAIASCPFCSARYSGVMPVRCVRVCLCVRVCNLSMQR